MVDIVHGQGQSTKIERSVSICPQESERDGVPEVVCASACQAAVQHGVIGILYAVTGIAVLRARALGRLRGRDMGAAYQHLKCDSEKVNRASDARSCWPVHFYYLMCQIRNSPLASTQLSVFKQ